MHEYLDFLDPKVKSLAFDESVSQAQTVLFIEVLFIASAAGSFCQLSGNSSSSGSSSSFFFTFVVLLCNTGIFYMPEVVWVPLDCRISFHHEWKLHVLPQVHLRYITPSLCLKWVKIFLKKGQKLYSYSRNCNYIWLAGWLNVSLFSEICICQVSFCNFRMYFLLWAKKSLMVFFVTCFLLVV